MKWLCTENTLTIPFVGAKAGVTSNDKYQYPFGYIFGTSSYEGGAATKQYYYGSSTSSTTSSTYYIPSSLKSVTVKGGNILYGAFRSCTGLTSVTIGSGVTSIGSYAFPGCTGLTSVTIGYGVKSIGQSAFSSCTGLTTVNWNATACTSACSSSYPIFSGCTSLTMVNIGDNVTTIPSCAFYNCSGLTSVTIPNRVTRIGSGTFRGCSSLESITLPFVGATKDGTNNTHFGYIFGASSYSYNSSYVPSSLKTVVITGVSSIGKDAFEDCTGLTSVTIGNGVTSIGEYAFRGCTGLTNVTIPDSVTSIGDEAFYGCYKLVEVYNKSSLKITAGSYKNGYVWYYAKAVYTEPYTSKLSTDSDGYLIYTDGEDKILVGYTGSDTELALPSGITEINQYAFSGCSGLSNITIPDSVTSIGKYAFEDCTGLTSVTIGNGVTSIDSKAFKNCSKLTTVNWNATACTYAEHYYGYIFNGCTALTMVNIGDNVTSIPNYAFSGCTGLTSVTVSSGNTVYHSEGNCLIRTANKTLILGCKNSVIPSDGSVTSIGISAFSGCTGLTSITIPDSVTSIGSYAFYNCTGLASVTIPDSVASIGGYAFWCCTSLTGLTFEDTTTWYRATYSASGTQTDVTNASTNATYFKSTYYSYYWYKL